jgi:hypothetical protein
MFDRYTVGITTLLVAFIAILMGIHFLNSAPAEAQMDMPEMGDNMEYLVKLSTDPGNLQAGQPFRLTLDILKTDGETPVAEFDEVHTKLLHLILISQDLTQFLHVHPDYQGDGRFVLEDLTLPVSSNYIVFADFTPSGEHQQVVRLTLPTQDAQDSMPALSLTEREFVAGPLKFTLDVADTLNSGEETHIVFHITDAETGASLDTLDEYLGAGGHLVIVDEAGEVYLHTHPADHESDDMSGMNMTPSYGPDLIFDTEFPSTGLFKMWLQVQYQGEIYTAPFVINVTGMSEATSEATAESHSTHG